jgi:hypothetical protein
MPNPPAEVHQWHGWVQLVRGGHYHYVAGRKTLCGLIARSNLLVNPSTSNGFGLADCPDCHRVLSQKGHTAAIQNEARPTRKNRASVSPAKAPPKTVLGVNPGAIQPGLDLEEGGA